MSGGEETAEMAEGRRRAGAEAGAGRGRAAPRGAVLAPSEHQGAAEASAPPAAR